VDFGLHAGDTTNACFWLCLAAGLAASNWFPDSVDGQALPIVVNTYLTETRAMDLHLLDKATAKLIKGTPLGMLASTLRQHFCDGASSVLMRSDMMARIYQAFAGLQEDGSDRTLPMYTRWVTRLASNEFADELVLVAVAIELKIRILCIPFTPSTATKPWVISIYQDTILDIPDTRNVYVGNNDVHYMWLARETQVDLELTAMASL
jgi:hypothetical protein